MITIHKRLSILTYALCISIFSGCVLGPSFAHRSHPAVDGRCPATDSEGYSVEIAYGQPNKFIDTVGWVWGVPGKVLLWDRRVNNHQVTDETTHSVSEYLQDNNVDGVCVRINQYAPGDEWRRLTQNRDVGGGWRYTLGTLDLIGYTLIPGRIVGRDRYNPYTNSLYIYSDVSSLATQSAAYAKDVQQRDYPGTYAAINQLPVVSLWHETINTTDAIAYIDQKGNDVERLESLRILHPYYGVQVGGAFESVFGGVPIFQVAGALIGHISGRMQIRQRPSVSGIASPQEARVRNDDTSQLSVDDSSVVSASLERPVVSAHGSD